ncbi:DUF6695 family protein [Sphingobacterium griseoflavum]|uniref:Uncharacterized protein n=1 Tax=Sphingobacterium griseoflavum TaxID=1474952 RepID=A0ABQ3HXZ6_9SPHI|nr:DUF6695 family protein [Sphingobacterium griseoflavum]GHE45826.1 hypothetical protein GCM10017764_31380 [Sphingobacterium griseoflavum]
MTHTFHDIAIPIAWPDKTARGDEKWMAFLKRMGIVKNLNFRVGHAAILLIERRTGAIQYFDFGRYLVPRGYGRPRSFHFDPRLIVETRAQFNKDGDIQNLADIFEELSGNEKATHGGGRTFFSISKGLSFSRGQAYAERLVSNGPVLYGAFARNNNSCSRFVAQILTEAMPEKDKRRKKILYPESLKASPMSNVVNAAENGRVYIHQHHNIQTLVMGRAASMRFQFDLLKDNFTHQGAKSLAADDIAGLVAYSERPRSVASHAQWLGGIGEGAWFSLQHVSGSLYEVTKHDADGQLLYTRHMECLQHFDMLEDYAFTYHFSFEAHSISQNDQLYLFRAIAEEKTAQNLKQANEAIL